MNVEVSYRSEATIVLTLADAYLSANDQGVTYNGLNLQKTLNAGSAQPATRGTIFLKALVAGAGTIDLTALPGLNGGTIDATGLKVQILKARGKSTNANPITLTKGASNGYQLAGASWNVALGPNQEFLFYGHDATPDVAAGAKTIDLAGTGTQELEIEIVVG